MAQSKVFQITVALNFFNLKPSASNRDIARAYGAVLRAHPAKTGYVNTEIRKIARAARKALRNYDPSRPPPDFTRERNLFANVKKALEFAAQLDPQPKIYLDGSWLWIWKRTWPAADDHLIARSKWIARPKQWDPETLGVKGWYFKPRHGAGSGWQGLPKEDGDGTVTFTPRPASNRGPRRLGSSGIGGSSGGPAPRFVPRPVDDEEDEDEISPRTDDEVAEEEE